MSKDYLAPFAITATTIGKPKYLYTKILLVNLDCDDKIAAAYVNALWDTGAATSVMTRDLAERLGFRFSVEVLSRGVTGNEMSKFGYAYVSLVSNGGILETRTGIVDRLPRDDYSFIIGMDIIGKGNFAISSDGLTTTLSFTVPGTSTVDFTKTASEEGKLSDHQELNPGPEDRKVFRGLEAMRMISQKIHPKNDQK
ncbi:MAG: hypothetical protein HDS37_03430 [Bacteroides sp.]|nr:hypothetical protein [Bacteroides sp.]